MVSRRYKDKQSVGTRINATASKVEKLETSSAIGTNEITEVNLDTNSVGPDALQTNAVTSDAIDRGAVGTENLGIVNKIKTDNNLIIEGPIGYRVVLENYPFYGSTNAPLFISPSKEIVVGGTGVLDPVTYSGKVVGVYSSGYAPVQLYASDGSVIGTVRARPPVGATSLSNAFVTVARSYEGVYFITGIFPTNYLGGPIPGQGYSTGVIQRAPLTPSGGWSRYNALGTALSVSFSPVVVQKSIYGRVTCQGIFGGGTGTAGTVIATLPEGFRPPRPLWFPSVGTGNIYTGLRVGSDGAVSIMRTITGGAGSFVSLNNISFSVREGQLMTTPTYNSWSPNVTSPMYWDYESTTDDLVYSDSSLIWVQGIIGGGTTTINTKMRDLPAGTAPPLALHFAGASDVGNIGGFGVSGVTAEQFATKGITGGSIAINAVWSKFSGTQAFSYANSWTDHSVTFPGANYRMRNDGYVQLGGLIKSGTIGSVTAFTLPPGYRPAWRMIFASNQNGAAGRIDINPDGTVFVVAGSNGWVTLENILFNPSPLTNQPEIEFAT